VEKPKVTIIIPTYNSDATLAACLCSVRNQSYSPTEIIIVDNFSNDATVAIAKEFGTRMIQQKSTPAVARNIGIANSTGKYIFFLDSDQVLSPSVIAECVEKCEREKVEMVRVPEIFVGKGFWSSCSATWKDFYGRVEQKHRRNGNILAGEPRFFIREQLVSAGMLDIGLFWGEDYDLHQRMSKAGVRETCCESKLHHYEPETIREILLKTLHYGGSMPIYTRRTGKRVMWPLARHSLLTFRELFKENKKQLPAVTGCAVLLCLKTYFMAFGLIKGSLSREL
jgi:glycosyltransferase involved in cell wall biosynthesis